MSAWFQQHGLPIEEICAEAAAAAVKERIANTSSRLPCTPASVVKVAAAVVAAAPAVSTSELQQKQKQQRCSQEIEVVPEGPAASDWLLISDFDKTLIDIDAGALNAHL